MRPEEDVRPVAGCCSLLEPHLRLVRVGDGYLYAGLRGVDFADFGNPVVALVAVDPDGELPLRNQGISGERGPEGGGKGKRGNQFLIHKELLKKLYLIFW